VCRAGIGHARPAALTGSDASQTPGELYYNVGSKSMGKRELILIATFAILGAIVYQFTAPPPGPGERSFSISRIVDHVRREVRGNRATVEHTSSATQAVEPAVSELRISLRSGPITIVGEDRTTVEVQLVARSRGYDEAEAQQFARQTQVKFDHAGAIMFARVEFPNQGPNTARLTLKVPSRLRIRIDGNSGKLEISNVTDVELGLARGETTIRNIRGKITASHRGGDLVIADAGALKLTTRGSDVRLEQILGEVTINSQAGDLKTSGLAGPIELESNATDVTLEGLEKTSGLLRVNAVSGSLTMRGLRTESRIDLRNAELDLVVDRPAALAIYSDGDEPVELTLPRGGFRLDAIARNAEIVSTPDTLLTTSGLSVKRSDTENKVSGDVNGGGPLLTIRTGQGNITLRAPGKPTASR
jgi:hypothetical protein